MNIPFDIPNIPYLDRFRRKSLVGMDIGNRSVKFVKRERGKETVSYLYPGNILSGDESEIAEFREFVRANGLIGSRAACGIDDGSLVVKRMELPKMPDYDLKEAVKWQMRDVVEGSVADYSVRHIVLEELTTGDGKKLSVAGFAMKASAIASLTQVLRKCALNPMVIEPSSVSLVAAFEEVQGCQKGQRYGLVDLGETKSFFAAVGDETLLFTRPLAGATGRELKGLLRKELSISEVEADALTRLLVGQGDPNADIASAVERLRDTLREKAGSLLSGHYTTVAIEIQRSIDAFALTFRRDKIDQLFLCGGGATLKGLTEHLATNLAIPTAVLDPSARGITAESPHLYNIAFGLSCYPL